MHRCQTALIGLIALGAALVPASGVSAQSASCTGQPTASDGQCLGKQPLDVQAAFSAAWGAQAAQEWATGHNASLPGQGGGSSAAGTGPCAGQPTARDGACLGGQPAATQALYAAVWAAQAAQEWVAEHNAALGSGPAPPPAPAPAPPAPSPTPSSLAQSSGGAPIVGFEQPCPNETIGTASGPFTIIGYAFDPTAGPSGGSGISRVDLSLNGAPNTGGSQILGSTSPSQSDPRAGALYGARWQSGTRWTLGITPNTLNTGGLTLYAVAYSALTGRLGQASISISIVLGEGYIMPSC